MESRAGFGGILGAAALQSEDHVGQQQCVALVLRYTIFHKRGFSQINVTTPALHVHQREGAVSCAPKRAAFRGRSSSRCRRQTFHTSCGSFCRTPRGAEAKPSNVNKAIVS